MSIHVGNNLGFVTVCQSAFKPDKVEVRMTISETGESPRLFLDPKQAREIALLLLHAADDVERWNDETS